MAAPAVTSVDLKRIHARTKQSSPKAVPLSLLDATTAEFSLTRAIWIFRRDETTSGVDLERHLSDALSTTLDAYPHFAGQLVAIKSLDGSGSPETNQFPSHARRFGRIYAYYGTDIDPGVEFVSASSSMSMDKLHPPARMRRQPIWNPHKEILAQFLPPTTISTPLRSASEDGKSPTHPLMAIQVTTLPGGDFVIGAKVSHPLADITSLVSFLQDWASFSRAALVRAPNPTPSPVFEPCLVDGAAAGDINLSDADTAIIQHAESLPLSRYDWWLDPMSCPWGVTIPEPFRGDTVIPAGIAMPWSEWDTSAPVSNRIVHLSREEVDGLYTIACRESEHNLSRHDAVVAHIWSCVVRARGLSRDLQLVHCALVYGVRPALQLGTEFVGPPVIMVNIELPASDVAATRPHGCVNEEILSPVANQVRSVLTRIASRVQIASHLHSIAYEKTPQRIWQGFLGTRHIMVTSWARAGVYEVDFGLGSVLYVEGIVPDMDGTIIIKEAPCLTPATSGERAGWTDGGVDISIHLRTEVMDRLVDDTLLVKPGLG